MFKKIFFYFSIILLLLASLFCLFTNFKDMSIYLRLLLVILPEIILMLLVIFKWKNYNVLYKLFLTIYLMFSFIIIIYTILDKLNVFDKFSSVHSLKEYILSTGSRGVLIYVLIQTLQVIFLPIPASIICIVGSLIYGPWMGGIFCSIGVLLGSFVSFFIGKIFGYKLVTWIVGKDNTNKYSEIIRTKGMFFLGLAFLLPMFPDDILCFIAGISNLSIKKFLIITTITRPIGVICMSIFGSGYIIPFSGWGIYAWSGILVVAIALVVIVFKWQDQMQSFILNKVFHKNNKKSA